MSSAFYCNAVTVTGARCRRRVSAPGMRCTNHRQVPFSEAETVFSRYDLFIFLATVFAAGLGIAALVSSAFEDQAGDLPGWATVVGVVVASLGTLMTLRLSARSNQQKMRAVESEMAEALGIPPAGSTRVGESENASSYESENASSYEEGREIEEPPDAGSDRTDSDSPANNVEQSPDYRQNVIVNIDNNKASSMLAGFARQQSDGNARMIIKYYAQGHRQASVSFILSMTFAIAGFAIATIAVVGYILHPSDLAQSVVAGTVGAVIEVVSLLFFRRADKGRDLMMGLVDKLRDDREKESQFVAALAMIDQVDSESMKDALRAAVVLRFTDSPIAAEQLASLMQSDAGRENAHRSPAVHIYGPTPNGDTPLSQTTSTTEHTSG